MLSDRAERPQPRAREQLTAPPLPRPPLFISSVFRPDLPVRAIPCPVAQAPRLLHSLLRPRDQARLRLVLSRCSVNVCGLKGRTHCRLEADAFAGTCRLLETGKEAWRLVAGAALGRGLFWVKGQTAPKHLLRGPHRLSPAQAAELPGP